MNPHRMNETIGERIPQALIENQRATTIVRKGSAVPQQQRGRRFRERTARMRGNNLLLRQTLLASRIRYKNEVILVPDAVNENESLLAKKYLSMKKAFSQSRTAFLTMFFCLSYCLFSKYIRTSSPSRTISGSIVVVR